MYRVGIIGLGKMGMPIAHNLAGRGFEIIGYRRKGSPELIAAGGTVAASPANVAERAEVLLSILPDAHALEGSRLRPRGHTHDIAARHGPHRDEHRRRRGQGPDP